MRAIGCPKLKWEKRRFGDLPMYADVRVMSGSGLFSGFKAERYVATLFDGRNRILHVLGEEDNVEAAIVDYNGGVSEICQDSGQDCA